jgi:hypothetical protein
MLFCYYEKGGGLLLFFRFFYFISSRFPHFFFSVGMYDILKSLHFLLKILIFDNRAWFIWKGLRALSQILCCLVYHRPNVYHVRTTTLYSVYLLLCRSGTTEALSFFILLPRAQPFIRSFRQKAERRKFLTRFNSSNFIYFFSLLSILHQINHLSTSVFSFLV